MKERAFKISRVMTAWLITEEINNDESDVNVSMSWALFDVNESDSSKAIRILTLSTYKETVQDSV